MKAKFWLSYDEREQIRLYVENENCGHIDKCEHCVFNTKHGCINGDEGHACAPSKYILENEVRGESS